ncbi:MAG: orotate phosphoribosyltransferase [Paludibacteraceae bacterium]|nr:orotate phosphoribosyltransferase [Paludibacteraceae bacterium]
MENKELADIVAENLVHIKAIKIQPNNSFILSNGWQAPVYCDTRKALSNPRLRAFLKSELSRLILERYPDVDVIAGLSTGSLVQAVLVADLLGLPFVYVRQKPKDHGLENLIEGDIKPRQKVVVIEDIITTGTNCLRAVDTLRRDGAVVLGAICIFTYGFSLAFKAFEEADVELTTLCDFDTVLRHSLEIKHITSDDVHILEKWHKMPQEWNDAVKPTAAKSVKSKAEKEAASKSRSKKTASK